MIIGVVKCTEENLIGLVPKVAAKFIQQENEVWIEKGAGSSAQYADQAFLDEGAKISTRKEILAKAQVIITYAGLNPSEIKEINKQALVIGKFNARVESDLITAFENSSLKAFSLDLLPRSTIAQSMDVLSSLASLSGYKAALLAADNFGGYLPMMTTSAGTIPPARVMILGAGVAGLQAIATAKRLGAVVEAFDVRSAVKEEVQSLGAKFIEVEGAAEDKDAGGYAVEQSEEYIQKQKELIHQTALKADIVITTANIPGRQAPQLIEERTVNEMKPGSVIVDMASASGGNVALSKDDVTIDVNGVKVIGDSKLYNSMAHQASLLYSNNVFNFLQFILKEGIEAIPYENDIVSNTILNKDENAEKA